MEAPAALSWPAFATETASRLVALRKKPANSNFKDFIMRILSHS
jgi:hypothetical protein